MASILKVSQLQKPDGSTPTAADLGLDIAGNVLQMKVINKTGYSQTQTTNAETAITNWGTHTFTKTKADSTIVCLVKFFAHANASNPPYWYIRAFNNGTPVIGGADSSYASGAFATHNPRQFQYNQGAHQMFMSQFVDTQNTTDCSFTFTFKGDNSNSLSIWDHGGTQFTYFEIG